MNLGFDSLDYLIMVGYLLATVGLGFYFSQREKDTEDYFLGGRKMPTFIIAVSMFVTLFSAISFVAVPGEAYEHGLGMSLAMFVAPIGTIIGFALFVRFYFRVKSFTPFEYLQDRYGVSVRIFISCIFIIMRLLYLGVVMYASAKAFKGATGWPIWVTILVVGAVGIFYTTLGGMKAVVWTDFLQFMILIFGLGFVFYKLSSCMPTGWSGVLKHAFESGRGYDIVKHKEFYSFNPFERYTLWLVILNMIAAYTFYFGCDQMTIQRLLSTPSYAHAKKATLTNLCLSLPISALFWLIGLGLFSFYNSSNSPQLPESIHPNEIFSYFMITELPSPVPGILMAALLAAVMSTIDSGMNSLSAVFVKDLYKPFIKPLATQREELVISKITTVVWGLLFLCFGLIISFLSETVSSSILEVAGIWGALLGIASGAFLLGVTTKRAHSSTIFISSGFALITLFVLSWKFYYSCPVDERISFNIIGTCPFLVMLIVGYPLSLIFPNRSEEAAYGYTLWTYKHGLQSQDLSDADSKSIANDHS